MPSLLVELLTQKSEGSYEKALECRPVPSLSVKLFIVFLIDIFIVFSYLIQLVKVNSDDPVLLYLYLFTQSGIVSMFQTC